MFKLKQIRIVHLKLSFESIKLNVGIVLCVEQKNKIESRNNFGVVRW